MATAILSKGSPKPPAITDGKLRVYGRPMSVALEKIQIVLNVLKVPYETVLLSYDSLPEWYAEVQPEEKIPAIDTGSEVLAERRAMFQYLLKNNPDPSVVDETHKEADLKLADQARKVDDVFRAALLSRNKSDADTYHKEVGELLKLFVEEIKKRGTPYLKGATPGITDYILWPTVERIRVVSKVLDLEPPPADEAIATIVRKWKDGILQVKGVKEVQLDVEKFVSLIKERK